MKIKINGGKTGVQAKKVSSFGRYSGLMFKTRNTPNLLLEFKKSESAAIHSFFVFFNFLAVWLDENNNVVDFRIVKPFTFLVKPKKPSRKLLEIPVNKNNASILKIFDEE